MIKWLAKLKWFWLKRDRIDPKTTTFFYGRYAHKPVLGRALNIVTGIGLLELTQLEIYLNQEKVDTTKFLTRLESGSYEIRIPALHKAWTFFIA